MGRRTGHAVAEVRLDLEDAPAHTVNIRYEFRPQLARRASCRPLAQQTRFSVANAPEVFDRGAR